MTTPTRSAKTPAPRFRPGNPEAADAIWHWRGGQPTPAAGHELAMPATLARREGILRGLVGGGIGTLIFFFWHATLAWVVWGIATFTLLAALLSPSGVYRGIQKAVGWLSMAIGGALSWVLLPLFFYVFCLPFGLLARRGLKDKLERWFDSKSPTYWKKRTEPERDAAFYERQF